MEKPSTIGFRIHPCDLNTTASFNHSGKGILNQNLIYIVRLRINLEDAFTSKAHYLNINSLFRTVN